MSTAGTGGRCPTVPAAQDFSSSNEPPPPSVGWQAGKESSRSSEPRVSAAAAVVRSLSGWRPSLLWQDMQCLALWVLLLANVCALVVEAILAGSHVPGPPFSRWSEQPADCCGRVTRLLMGSINLRMGVSCGTLTAYWLCKVIRISLRQRPGTTWQHASRRSLWYSDWTAAASKDVFSETSRITKAAQTLGFIYCALTTALLSVIAVTNETLGFHQTHHPLQQPHTRLEGFINSWCLFPHLFLPLHMFLLSGTLFVPLRLWSAATCEAVAVANDTRLWRILHSHWLTAPAVAVTTALFCIYARLLEHNASDVEQHAYIVMAPGLLLYQLIVSAWTLGFSRDTVYGIGPGLSAAVRSVGRLLRRHARQSSEMARRISKVAVPASPQGHRHRRRRSSQPTLGLPSVISMSSSVRTNSLTEVAYVFSTKEAGVVLRRKLILTFTLLIMAVGSYGQPVALCALLFLARAIALAMLLLTRDEEVKQFTDLRGFGVGFGLVVKAAHLRRALAAYLSHDEYNGPLHKHKASVFRMAQTLAVSYRWQAHETVICPGLRLNMSEWQLRSLLDALTKTGVLYVWIDRVSVPQKKRRSSTQKTLLARMMAVYASANTTLCLRSIEQDGSRYHQRYWTLQEYCAANTIRVETETCSCGSSDISCMFCEGETAVADEEESFFQQFRQEMLGRMHQCRPSWLYGAVSDMMTAELAVEVVDRFYELQHRVYCQHSVDKIRSLYPMLSNIPVENHSDLNRLVKMVSRIVIASCPLQPELNPAVDRHRAVAHQRKSMMCLLDDEEDQALGRTASAETPHGLSSQSSISPTLRPSSLSYRSWGGRLHGLFALRENGSSPSGSSRTLPAITPLPSIMPVEQALRGGSLPNPRFMQRATGNTPFSGSASAPVGVQTSDGSLSTARGLMDRAQTIRGSNRRGTPAGNAKRLPAEMRAMETLLAPTTESGWLRRKSLAAVPSGRRSTADLSAAYMASMEMSRSVFSDLDQ